MDIAMMIDFISHIRNNTNMKLHGATIEINDNEKVTDLEIKWIKGKILISGDYFNNGNITKFSTRSSITPNHGIIYIYGTDLVNNKTYNLTIEKKLQFSGLRIIFRGNYDSTKFNRELKIQ